MSVRRRADVENTRGMAGAWDVAKARPARSEVEGRNIVLVNSVRWQIGCLVFG